MIRLSRKGVVAPRSWRATVRAAFTDYDRFERLCARFERLPVHGKVRKAGFVAWLEVKGWTRSCCNRDDGFPPVWGHASEKLQAMSGDRCAFCQSQAEQGQVEHWRPKSRFPSHAYRWKNYFPACGHCNSTKQMKWPRGVGWVRPDDAKRDPYDRFCFHEDGTVTAAAGDRGAAKTIEDFGLGRENLVRVRAGVITKELASLRIILGGMKWTPKTDPGWQELETGLMRLRSRNLGVFSAAVSQCVERELARRGGVP